jgi:hypothetical protein
MFRKKSRLFWGCALLLFLLVDLFLLWKVGIVSLGELDTYKDMNFGQSSTDTLKNSKETVTKKKFGDQKRAIPVSESKRKKVQSKNREIIKGHGLNCVCKDCRTWKNGRGSLFPIDN